MPIKSHWFKATVLEHSAKSNSIAQTYDVAFVLAPPDGLKVFPGMTATVQVRISENLTAYRSFKNTTRIPVEALCRDNDGQSYVWLIGPASMKPRRIVVESAELFGDYVDIRSDLRSGEHVAVGGLHLLQEDILVRPMLDGREGS